MPKNDSMKSTVKSMYMLFVIAAAMAAAIAAGTGVLILGTSFRVYKGTNTRTVRHLVEIPQISMLGWVRRRSSLVTSLLGMT